MEHIEKLLNQSIIEKSVLIYGQMNRLGLRHTCDESIPCTYMEHRYTKDTHRWEFRDGNGIRYQIDYEENEKYSRSEHGTRTTEVKVIRHNPDSTKSKILSSKHVYWWTDYVQEREETLECYTRLHMEDDLGRFLMGKLRE